MFLDTFKVSIRALEVVEFKKLASGEEGPPRPVLEARNQGFSWKVGWGVGKSDTSGAVEAERAPRELMV